MDKTIRVFRGLYNLRSCNRVFTLKYCTSREDGKDSGEKDESSETLRKASAQERNVNESEIKTENLKCNEDGSLSSGNEAATSHHAVDAANINFINKKVEPVETDAESDVSSAKDFSEGNEKSTVKKLEKLMYASLIEKNCAPDSSPDFNLNSDLQSYKEKFETLDENVQMSKIAVNVPNYSFASLLRRSAFIDLGDPVNKLVVGEIYLTVDDDLYVEFGWKFPAVCSRPKVNPEIYNIGAKVLLRIKDLELTARFLGEKEYTSLLEADCDIIYRINEDGTKFVKPKSETKTSNHAVD